MISSLICLAAFSAAMQESERPAPSYEVWDYRRRWNLENRPVKNAFTIEVKGALILHSPASGSRHLLESGKNEWSLKKVKLKGSQVPPSMFPRKWRSYSEPRKFKLLHYPLDGKGSSINRDFQAALLQLYVDGDLLDGLSRLCRFHWKTIQKGTRGKELEAQFEWLAPHLFAIFTCAQEGRKIRITASGLARKSGSGQRSLEYFEFEGDLDSRSERFLRIKVRGKIVNRGADIHTWIDAEHVRREIHFIARGGVSKYQQLMNLAMKGAEAERRHEWKSAARLYEEISREAGPFQITSTASLERVRKKAQSVDWIRGDLNQAKDRARKEGKLIFVMFVQDG